MGNLNGWVLRCNIGSLKTLLGIVQGMKISGAPQGDAHHTDALPLFVHHVKHDFHAISVPVHQPARHLPFSPKFRVQVALPWIPIYAQVVTHDQTPSGSDPDVWELKDGIPLFREDHLDSRQDDG